MFSFIMAKAKVLKVLSRKIVYKFKIISNVKLKFYKIFQRIYILFFYILVCFSFKAKYFIEKRIKCLVLELVAQRTFLLSTRRPRILFNVLSRTCFNTKFIFQSFYSLYSKYIVYFHQINYIKWLKILQPASKSKNNILITLLEQLNKFL